MWEWDCRLWYLDIRPVCTIGMWSGNSRGVTHCYSDATGRKFQGYSIFWHLLVLPALKTWGLQHHSCYNGVQRDGCWKELKLQ
jgi:hypothetical protein